MKAHLSLKYFKVSQRHSVQHILGCTNLYSWTTVTHVLFLKVVFPQVPKIIRGSAWSFVLNAGEHTSQ